MAEVPAGFRTLFPEVEFPIIQAPMAGTATPELAAAVSNAGALGSLGIGTSSVDAARDLIVRTQQLTSRPFNVNLFCHQPPLRGDEAESAWLKYLQPLFHEVGASAPTDVGEAFGTFLNDEESFQMLLETRPKVISFHFGFPSPEKIAAFKFAGITLLATATNVNEAKEIEAAGIDAIVAQGIEAGGHRGVFDPDADDQRLSTSVLVRQLVSSVHIPVIAAGGIMDGQGIRSMLELGAVAAQLGTAFILCPESAANDAYRQTLQSGRSARTRHTRAFTGRQARAIVNRLMDFEIEPDAPPAPAYPLPTSITKHLNGFAVEKGIHEFTGHWAGQGAPLAREMPARDLVLRLVEGMEVQ